MFLRKLHNFKNSLLFRLTILYAVAFTALSTIGFLIFYYRIYTVTMDRLDLELLEKTQKYMTLAEEASLKGVLPELTDEAESEDPQEDFYRLFNLNGDILFTTDMSFWGTIPKKDILLKMQNEGLTYAIQIFINFFKALSDLQHAIRTDNCRYHAGLIIAFLEGLVLDCISQSFILHF